MEGQQEKCALLCLIVEGDWNYMGRVEVVPKIFKIAVFILRWFFRVRR